MKLKMLLLTALVSCLSSGNAFGEEVSVPKQIALRYAKNIVRSARVDYYLIGDESENVWTIFVDLEPLKGFGHNCCVITVPKVADPLQITSLSTCKYQTTVPAGPIQALELVDRYKNRNNIPDFVSSTNNLPNSEVASRTYAVILSGGYDKFFNYERYWNDCSFLYKTLKQSYGVPQENISVIMSDGTSSAVDMHTTDGRFISSPLDLDGDGVNDIKYSATKSNVKSVLNTLKNKMKRDDHLLFFVIDHGGSDDNISTSYINLWGNQVLYDHELASYLTPLLDKDVSVNVVLGQCFSGGFVDDLSEIGCVVATASSGSESSYACGDRPYDEFVYHWTSAINGRDPYGEITDADYNRDGKVTMDEAFRYAKEKDSYSASTSGYKETPQYDGGPYSYANYLSFTYLPKSDFLMIRDNPDDIGEEPNPTVEDFWNSPDIWIRNEKDGIEQHESPYYTTEHETAYIYRKIYNAGEKEFRGNGRWTLINWAEASTGINSTTWRGREWDSNYRQTGGSLESISIGSIPPGRSLTQYQNWSLPSSIKECATGYYHYCLYCRILDAPSDEVIIDSSQFRPLLSNKAAQKNLSILRKDEINDPVTVIVRNILDNPEVYTLEVQPKTTADKSLFDVANVEMSMSAPIYKAWDNGGLQGEDIQIVSKITINQPVGEEKKIRLLSPNSKVKGIQLEAKEFDLINMRFNFHSFPFKTNTTYTIDLVQKNKKGEIIGGESFMIEAPGKSLSILDIGKETSEEGKTILSVNNDDVSSVKWFDEAGDIIGEASSIEIEGGLESRHYTAVGFTESGEAATGNITIEKDFGISRLNVDRKSVDIDFINPTPANSSIEIVPIDYLKNVIATEVENGAQSVTVNDAGIEKGIYTVRYLIEGTLVDSRKIMIND